MDILKEYEKSWKPTYHFHTSERIQDPFDPNGAIYWKGRWHVFYLFSDETVAKGLLCWGHISSADLVNWKRHSVAMECDQPGEVALASGNALLDKNGVPTIFYSSGEIGICFAQSTDDELEHWHKSPHNPVIRQEFENEAENKVFHVFDPHVWFSEEDDCYYAVLGATRRPFHEYDACYMFGSKDMISWEYLRPFYDACPQFSVKYNDCACPDFFPVGNGKWVLHCLSHTHGARYYVGDFIQGTFLPESHHLICYPGGNTFAPESCLGPDNRRIAWYWLRNRLCPLYADLHSLENIPGTYNTCYRYMRETWTMHELKFSHKKNKLLQFMPKEIDTLCHPPQSWEIAGCSEQAPGPLPFKGRVGKLSLKAFLPEDGRLSLKVLLGRQGTQCMEIIIDRKAAALILDHHRALLPQSPIPTFCNLGAPEEHLPLIQKIFWTPDQEGCYSLSIYLDNSVVEVFSEDGEFAGSQLIYTSNECDAMEISEITAGSRIDSLIFCPMNAATSTCQDHYRRIQK